MKIIKGKARPIDEYDLVHGGPTTGKSVVIANWSKTWLIDPDVIIWGPMLTKADNAILKKLEVAPWYAHGDQRAQWRAVENGAKIVAMMLAETLGATIVTNGFYHGLIKDLSLLWRTEIPSFRNSITVFRQPESMLKMAKERSEAKGSKFTGSLSVFESWYDGWSKYHSSYQDVVILEDGEFLADCLGITPTEIDPLKVEAINYSVHAQAFREFFKMVK